MVVGTVQCVIVISGTLIIRALLFETSLGSVGSAANFTCFEDLLRHVEDCFDFVGSHRQSILLPGAAKVKVKVTRNVA